jgi:hypothetical protein
VYFFFDLLVPSPNAEKSGNADKGADTTTTGFLSFLGIVIEQMESF